MTTNEQILDRMLTQANYRIGALEAYIELHCPDHKAIIEKVDRMVESQMAKKEDHRELSF